MFSYPDGKVVRLHATCDAIWQRSGSGCRTRGDLEAMPVEFAHAVFRELATAARSLAREIFRLRSQELREIVLPKLRGSVFHVTTRPRYRGIVRERAILNNKDGRFPFLFGQSANSWGRKRGYVCLFDLRTATDEQVEFGLDRLYFLDPAPDVGNPLFLLLDASFHAELIPWTAGTSQEMRIPQVECWYPGDVELTKIRKVIDVRVKRPPLDPYTRALQQVRRRPTI